ncbi:MAG TPA: spondin domain-containing protein [Gemmatimonadales bacterium]|nr:spondin domain-containing protein [Gemmatimonadales bacterium]
MSRARAVPILLSLAAYLAPAQARAQYEQPWIGRGIPSQQGTSENQLRVAQRSLSAAGVRRQAAPQAAGRATRFMIRVENISKGEALELSNAQSAPFVSAPVLWVVHTGSTNPIFTGGQRDSGEGLELLAETGDPSKLVQSLARKSGIVAAGAYARPVGATAQGPLTPGQRYEFQIYAQPGMVLSTAWMFGQSNDLFYSNDRPIPLFSSSGKPRSPEITTQLFLWDAGTEVNEEPGLGPSQGPRQTTPDAGVTESQGIAHVRDQYTYPRIGDVLRVTVTPVAESVSAK